MSKKKKLVSKVIKYSVLLSIKESYLFCRNLLGLLIHPFKTIRVIVREKDYSQAALVFGLPFYTFIAGFVFIIAARFFINAPATWGWLAKSTFLLVSLVSLFMFLYLSYWLIKILKVKKWPLK